jgi:hypothetical protein
MGLMSIIFIAVGFSMDAFAVHTEKAFLMPGLLEKSPLWYNQDNITIRR